MRCVPSFRFGRSNLHRVCPVPSGLVVLRTVCGRRFVLWHPLSPDTGDGSHPFHVVHDSGAGLSCFARGPPCGDAEVPSDLAHGVPGVPPRLVCPAPWTSVVGRVGHAVLVRAVSWVPLRAFPPSPVTRTLGCRVYKVWSFFLAGCSLVTPPL